MQNMKKLRLNILLLTFIFNYFQSVHCQDIKNEFTGTLQLDSKEIVTFKIQFKVKENGEIEGTSLTDIYGPNRTLSKISGIINIEKNSLSFEEIENINTKSNAEAEEFCFLKVENASLKIDKEKSVLKGNFIGKYKNGKKCASGYLYLVNKGYIDVLAEKYLSKNAVSSIDSLLKMKQLNNDIQAKVGNTYLTNNQVMRLNWTSSEIIIEVSDGSREDGDEIAIYIDSKKILDSFVIGKDKKTIIVPYSGGKVGIRIQAISEGKLKSCTANITLRDNDNNTNVIANMTKGSNVVIMLNKKILKNALPE
jgi:hypothetical protein